MRLKASATVFLVIGMWCTGILFVCQPIATVGHCAPGSGLKAHFIFLYLLTFIEALFSSSNFGTWSVDIGKIIPFKSVPVRVVDSDKFCGNKT